MLIFGAVALVMVLTLLDLLFMCCFHAEAFKNGNNNVDLYCRFSHRLTD